jgi:uncharacterized protein YigE (DUF2233 family)
MKKILVAILILGTFLVVSYSQRLTRTETDKAEDVLGSPATESPQVVQNVNYENQTYSVIVVPAYNINSLKLYSNLVSPKSSSDLLVGSNCKALINAGFYTKENTPVGFLKTTDDQSWASKESSLFNGFLTINDFGTPRITTDLPRDNVEIGVQSGPILYSNSFIHSLKIRNDKQARRVVAITTGDNELIFLAIYKQDAMFSGPFLQDLPKILDVWQNEYEITIADAINLDGGTASAVITEDIILTEASPIGSYFCIK